MSFVPLLDAGFSFSGTFRLESEMLMEREANGCKARDVETDRLFNSFWDSLYDIKRGTVT